MVKIFQCRKFLDTCGWVLHESTELRLEGVQRSTEVCSTGLSFMRWRCNRSNQKVGQVSCFQRRRHQPFFCTHAEIKPEFLTTSSWTSLTLWLFGHFFCVNNVSSNHRTVSRWFSFFIMLLVSALLLFSVIICVAILNVFLYIIGGCCRYYLTKMA